MKPIFLKRSLRLTILLCLMGSTRLAPSWSRAAVVPAPHAARQSAAEQRLAAALDAIVDAPNLRHGFTGVCVVRIRDYQVLYARNADQVFLPASNNKLLTSFAALETLPLDFAYHTQVRALGTLDAEGVLHGDLALVGGGDPLLSLADLEMLARQVTGAGVRRVSGRLIYDDTRFDAQCLGDGWNWDDEAASYSAQISALNVNGNCVSVQVVPGKRPGARVGVQITPPTRYVRVENTAVTGAVGSASTLVVDRKRGQNILTVAGTLPANRAKASSPAKPVPSAMSASSAKPVPAPAKQPAPPFAVDVTIENPAWFTVTLFGTALHKAGVQINTGAIISRRDIGAMRKRFTAQGGMADTRSEQFSTSEAVLLAEHASPRLPELLTRMNKPSDNLMAECLLKAVGAQGTFPLPALPSEPDANEIPRVGTSGSSGTGAQMARKAFAAAGMDLDAVRQADGSGLSRGNYVSPRNLVRLLAAAHARPYFSAFYASLPIAGVDGTLRNRMKNTPAANNCRAKTGTLSHVSSLSGYVQTRDGEELAFSILMNHQLGSSRVSTRAQDSIAQLLAAYSSSP